MSGLARVGLVVLMFLLLLSHRLLEDRFRPADSAPEPAAEEAPEELTATVETAEVAPPDPPPEPRTYTVDSGDTLARISNTVYGSHRHWKAIFDANRHQLDDPSRLQIGMKLKIPDLE